MGYQIMMYGVAKGKNDVWGFNNFFSKMFRITLNFVSFMVEQMNTKNFFYCTISPGFEKQKATRQAGNLFVQRIQFGFFFMSNRYRFDGGIAFV